jgi:hypothetical protein
MQFLEPFFREFCCPILVESKGGDAMTSRRRPRWEHVEYVFGLLIRFAGELIKLIKLIDAARRVR